MTVGLSQFKALTFDCYGTLIDWETGIWDALQPLFARNPHTNIPRDHALTMFAKHEHALQLANPTMLYPDILRTVHHSTATDFGLQTDTQLDATFGASLPHWPAFEDSAVALRFLQRHYKLVILSNVNVDGFAASNRKLGVEFDAVYTAQDIGSYKPNPANFEFLLSRMHSDFGIEKEEILHTAQSLFHDHVPARALGLASAWIDRQHLSQGGNPGATHPVDEQPQSTFKYFSMAEFVEAVKVALGDAS